MRCQESSSSFFSFEFISPHPGYFCFSKNTIPSNSPPPGRKVRFAGLGWGIRPPCSKQANRLTTFLDTNIFPLCEPRFEHGKGIT